MAALLAIFRACMRAVGQTVNAWNGTPHEESAYSPLQVLAPVLPRPSEMRLPVLRLDHEYGETFEKMDLDLQAAVYARSSGWERLRVTPEMFQRLTPCPKISEASRFTE